MESVGQDWHEGKSCVCDKFGISFFMPLPEQRKRHCLLSDSKANAVSVSTYLFLV